VERVWEREVAPIQFNEGESSDQGNEIFEVDASFQRRSFEMDRQLALIFGAHALDHAANGR